MSLFPATDIVSDAARAADPRRVEAAMKRLETAGASLAAPRSDFGQSLLSSPASRRSMPHASDAAPGPGRMTVAAPESATQKFEAFFLQSWLEMILPKEESGVFGSGGAGGVWRSLMAEQLGGQLAKAGGVGLQKILDHNYPTPASSG